jgi:geranylgeranyl pyrophosphate synthase
LLCCQAAGGDPCQAEPVTAAWVLLYAAAHLLDSIQDGDPPDAWWEPLGSGPASNVATGLIATTSLLLTSGLEPLPSRDLLVQDFFQTVLQMSSAQHSDLTVPSPSLEGCWKVAEAKSGAFFGLACRAGARAAGIDEGLVSHYSTYGVSLGLLVQIGDDLGDLATVESGQSGHGQLALAAAYLRSVGSPEAPPELLRGLQASSSRLSPDPLVIDRLGKSGAGLYLHTKVHQFRQRGATALRLGAQPSTAVSELLELLETTPPDF